MDEEVLSGGSLSGPKAAEIGQSFTLTYALNKEQKEVVAQDLTIAFDADQLELSGPPEAVDANKITIVDSDTDTPGQLRILVVHLGEQAQHASGELIKLSFKVKPTASSGISNISIAKLHIADSSGVETVLQGHTHSVEIGVDKAALNALITNAQQKHDEAVEGNRIGQYPAGSKAALQAQIEIAKATANNPAATQAQIEQAALDLNAALQTFLALAIQKVEGDYNNDNTTSIGDLAIMVKAYGKSSVDADWNTVKAFDLNKDNMIDIQDLVALAKLILKW
nr:cohesin domain-containing protein [Bacillus sp. FJAT-26390]